MRKLLCKEQVQDKNNADMFYKKGEIYEFEDDRSEELLKAYNGRYFEEAKEEKQVTENVEVKEEKPKRKRAKADK